jgi:hypothetical protein
MNDVVKNLIYSVSQPDESHEFDLENLGEEVYRTFSPITSCGDGSMTGGEEVHSPVTSEDYDKQAFDRLTALEPVYRIPNFLNYHWERYVERLPEQTEVFVKHIEFVLLPMFRSSVREEYPALIGEWVKSTKKKMISEQLERKNEFLRQAYALACKRSSSPMSVDIIPIEFGKAHGFSEAETRRIVSELVADRYASSSLGMMNFFITHQGIKYLQHLETDSSHSANVYNISGSQGVNIISESKDVHIVQHFSSELAFVEKIAELIRKDYSIDVETRNEILDCLKEIKAAFEAGIKPKFTIKQLVEMVGSLSSVGSLVTTLVGSNA